MPSEYELSIDIAYTPHCKVQYTDFEIEQRTGGPMPYRHIYLYTYLQFGLFAMQVYSLPILYIP